MLAQPDATFSRLLAPGLTVEARDPIVLVEDFNQDGTPDMAVFDAGVYDLKVGKERERGSIRVAQ